MKSTDPEFDFFLAGHGMSRAGFDAAIEHAMAAYREHHAAVARAHRLAWSGPNKAERRIGHAYRIKPKLLGIGAPPLAIDGHAYRRRQKNRVKRRRR